jgi:chromosomal replication initiator protein
MTLSHQIDPAWREACAALCDDVRPTMHSIALEVARKHGISLDEIRGMCRERDLCAARWEAWVRCKRLGFSSTRIGRFFGDRDHSTILYGIRRYQGGA